jgi:GNAT superfamily N-acetyltransferase
MTFSLRIATLADVDALGQLIVASARALCLQEYTPAQIEAALEGAWGVDTQLIRDGTYFVAEAGSEVVGCGGWSKRRTLFGSDAQAGRSPEILDPATESARIRAFFVGPGWARRGVGRAILQRSEAAARAHGFRSVELLSTLSGIPLYRAAGYVASARSEHVLPNGQSIGFVPMRKELAAPD